VPVGDSVSGDDCLSNGGCVPVPVWDCVPVGDWRVPVGGVLSPANQELLLGARPTGEVGVGEVDAGNAAAGGGAVGNGAVGADDVGAGGPDTAGVDGAGGGGSGPYL
jgi:hypothetical protein